MEQQRPEEALQQLQASMQKWYPALQKAHQADSDEEDSDVEADEPAQANGSVAPADTDAAEAADGSAEAADGSASMSDDAEDLEEQLPSFEFRFETAKLLIELDDTTEAAVQVLTACTCILSCFLNDVTRHWCCLCSAHEQASTSSCMAHLSCSLCSAGSGQLDSRG